MENETLSLLEQLQGLIGQAEAFGLSMLRPFRLIQLGMAVALFGVAHLFNLICAPRVREWMRTLEGRPKWQLRALLVLQRRIRIIVFTILIWSTIFVMTKVLGMFPSRAYILSIIGTIALAWLVVGLIARFIRNPFLRRLVTWGALAYVTLFFLGLVDETSQLLDNLAVEFGDFKLSLLAILKALVVTALLFTIARLVSTTTSQRIQKNEDISPSMRVLVVKAVQVVLYASAFFIGLKAVGFDLTGLAVLSGAIGVGLGFGLQKVVSNLVSGVIILLDKSIKPGDVISLGETFGWINSLGARYVSVVTRDGKEYLIPNEDLITSQVVNWSHSNEYVRLDIFFGTAYGDDPHLVRRIAVEAAASVGRVLSFRAPVCHIVGFGDSSVDYILRFWIQDATEGLTNVRGNVYLALWDAFKKHEISIPFPQREVRMLDDQAKTMAQAID